MDGAFRWDSTIAQIEKTEFVTGYKVPRKPLGIVDLKESLCYNIIDDLGSAKISVSQ